MKIHPRRVALVGGSWAGYPHPAGLTHRSEGTPGRRYNFGLRLVRKR